MSRYDGHDDSLAPGLVPPLVEAHEAGDGVTVRNTSDQPLMVALARVREADGPGGWRGCGMYTSGRHGGGRYYYYSLAPGESAEYLPYDSCAAAFRGAPLEYRIGRDRSDRGWWSDSAFAAPKGREHEYRP